MKELSVIVSHSLGSDLAKRRLVEKIEELQKEFKGKFTLDSLWENDSLKFQLKAAGIKTDGCLNVSDSSVSLIGTLPLTLTVFRGKIETTLKAELEKILVEGD
ncbi:MAG: polyhydroxyalkanoic acid system family protein [Kosmotogaceae bacterium]|nr:polyhydroxyalkanoic acid system family protein [Kosmotogaceae bacterium]